MAYHKSPEAPKRTFRDRKQPPRSLALPCFSSLLLQKGHSMLCWNAPVHVSVSQYNSAN